MNGSKENGEGASNSLQDDKANGNDNGPGEATVEPSAPPASQEPIPSTQPTSSLPNSVTTTNLEPDTPLLDDVNVSVGNTAPFDYGKKLFDQLNELKTIYIDQSTQLCNVYGKTSINNISVEDIKKSNKLQKKDLGELLLNVLNKCSYLCFDANLDSITDFKYDTQFQNISSELSKCVQINLEKYSVSQDSRLRNIEAQINQLNSYSNYLDNNSSQTGPNPVVQTNYINRNMQDEVVNVEINNPTQHIEDCCTNILPAELADRVTEFLGACDKFESNPENGHSVAMFGNPYHYNGSKHSNQFTEIPEPIKEVLDALHQKYPDGQFNSCLVNKYQGPQSFLPKHSDDELTIAPDSSICTVSLGHSCTVKFSEAHGQGIQEHVTEPNSLYVMSKHSQTYWQHQIEPNSSLPEDSTRYSLTFRHVDKKYLKSTIIFGDSNTRNLKFGAGKGTFGQNMPGKREEAIHLKDIEPTACCGYKNVFIHCGINDIKHHRVSSPGKIRQKFDELKAKVNEITALCPKSKVFVSPILPTKSQDWNRRAVSFNHLLFDFCKVSNGRIIGLNFSEFCDEYGNLRSDMGKYWNPSDPLHLGSKGISALVNIVRKCVFDSGVSSISYTDTLTGHSVSNHQVHAAVQSGHPRFPAT